MAIHLWTCANMSFLRIVVLFGLICGTFGSLRPSDYALRGLEKFGADADDVMYSGLVSVVCFDLTALLTTGLNLTTSLILTT